MVVFVHVAGNRPQESDRNLSLHGKPRQIQAYSLMEAKHARIGAHTAQHLVRWACHSAIVASHQVRSAASKR